MNKKRAAIEWINKSFQAIPYDIIINAYLRNDIEDRLKILTDEEGKYLTYSNLPISIHSFYLVSEKLDVEWILNNIEIMREHGFEVYESENHLFVAIDGIGYDFIEAHWLPLYEDRGLKWHEKG